MCTGDDVNHTNVCPPPPSNILDDISLAGR
uniref:Uncharacterized protein n=1 Tax=Arundo donax TaxID=35708 RepID=A0A0A9FQK2_ARUDO